MFNTPLIINSEDLGKSICRIGNTIDNTKDIPDKSSNIKAMTIVPSFLGYHKFI